MKNGQLSTPGESGNSSSHYIVGIGASAGGLEAINELFDNMPHDTGFSFIIVQHLSPDYKSLMSELLSKHTSMHVFEAEDGVLVKPNSVYLLPPRKVMTLRNGKLKLQEKVRDHQPNNSIDIFFESLAQEQKERAIGIILSGTGTDGTKGIEAIKANGGTIIVQDPMSAEFDGMPNSAIATGFADVIIAPEMIPDELIDFLQEAPLIRSFNAMNQQEEVIILDILDMILNTTGHDFHHYKRPTLTRRLAKRMAEKNIKSLRDYYHYLAANPDEVKLICQEFLINVTRFFRDEEAFETLKNKVLPDIITKRNLEKQVKIWVVGTSSGEEAYSIAMMIDEIMEEKHINDLSVKIFATDIDQQSLDSGSKGMFTEEAIKSVSSERLKKYFVKEGNSYRIIPSIRKMVVFAKHDITKDPPFSQIDFLSCRNMLIYMNPLLQKIILQKFHFAIRENGYLFLGPSENVGVLKDVVEDVDKKWKLFRIVSKVKSGEYETFLNPVDKIPYYTSHTSSKLKNALNHLSDIFKDTLLEEYSYAGIYIDRDFEVKQAIGNFKDYISFPEGNLNFNLLKLVSPDLSIALSTTIRKAMKDNRKTVQRRVRIMEKKKERCINIIVNPYLTQKNYLQPFLFILLSEEEVVSKKKKEKVSLSKKEQSSKRLIELEDELRDTKANLQAVIEEVESANEELQSSNEEIISANEELQSTNEELQSLNEELHTVNTEHQAKIKELIELNDDLNNYFNNTDIGQILIDRKLVIRKFSPVATRQVNFRDSDVGRSITDISTNFKDLDFINDLKTVMNTGEQITKEIKMKDDEIFLMRIAPYLRQGQVVDGVVVSFVNVSETRKLSTMLEAILDSSTSGILAKKAIRNEKGKIVDFEYVSVNKAAETMLDMEPGTVLGSRLKETFPTMDSFYFEKYIDVVENGTPMQFEFYNKSLNRWYEVINVRMMDGLVTTFTNITEKKRAADLLRQGFEDLKVTTHKLETINTELERSNFDLLQFASVASHDLKEPLRKIQAFGNILKDKANNKLDIKEQNYLEKVINSAKRMHTLVDDILTLSKLSNSQSNKEPTDLNKIVARIIDDLEITISDGKAKINVDKLPEVTAVSGQMHQLFQNLIINALKFSNKDRPVVKIYEQPVTEQMMKEQNIKEDYACIVVEDNGIGFEEKYAEKIFGIFQRLNGANFQGTGIGLAICKKIMEKHDGMIYAESKPGIGSKFYVLLPGKSKSISPGHEHTEHKLA